MIICNTKSFIPGQDERPTNHLQDKLLKYMLGEIGHVVCLTMLDQLLKCYYGQIFNSCNFRHFKEYLTKDSKCRFLFSNIYFSSGDI